jgi:hypothetical protein
MALYGAYPSASPGGSSVPSARRGSMGLALGGGIGVAIAGSVVWALIAYLTKHQFSLLAVLIGFGVGFAISRSRRGDPAAAVAGAVLALLGCALGTFLALVFAELRGGAGLTAILGRPGLIVHEYPGSVGALGILFWAIAAVIGFKYTMGLPSSRRRQPLQDRGSHGPQNAYRAPAASRPAPGGYGTPQAPATLDDHGLPQAPDEYMAPEPVVARTGPPWEVQPVRGEVQRAVQPATGEIRAVQPVTGEIRMPRALRAPQPAAVPRRGARAPQPSATNPRDTWAPHSATAAHRDAGLQKPATTQQQPAAAARHRAPEQGIGRHGAPQAATAQPPLAEPVQGQPASGQPMGGGGVGGQGSGLPKRQRPSGRHSRPPEGPGA